MGKITHKILPEHIEYMRELAENPEYRRFNTNAAYSHRACRRSGVDYTKDLGPNYFAIAKAVKEKYDMESLRGDTVAYWLDEEVRKKSKERARSVREVRREEKTKEMLDRRVQYKERKVQYEERKKHLLDKRDEYMKKKRARFGIRPRRK